MRRLSPFALVAIAAPLLASCAAIPKCPEPTPVPGRVDTVTVVHEVHDTVTRVDTLVRIETRVDTLVQQIPVVHVDTLVRIETRVRVDTLRRVDTLTVQLPPPPACVDTVLRRDTIVRRDTVFLPAAADTAQPPLPPGTYAGVLCDSLVVVQRTAAGRYFVLHTMAPALPGRPDTVFVTPDTVTASLGRPMPWVAVAVAPPNGFPTGTTARVAVAYLPGDTEVRKHACYDGPAVVFRWTATVPGD